MFDRAYLNKIGCKMQKYYTCEPDEGTYFVAMSYLTDEQRQYIVEKFDRDIEDEYFIEANGYTTRYCVEVPCGFYDSEGYMFGDLCEYLDKEGFVEV
jgi:hypothetical protein